MIGLTPRQAELLRFIQAEAREGRVPSYREMADAIGVTNVCAVHWLMAALKERGFIDAAYRAHRDLRCVVHSHGERFQFIPVGEAA